MAEKDTKKTEKEEERLKEQNSEASKSGNAEEEKAGNDVSINKKPEMVEIELFKDNGRYKDDAVVGVNGKLYTIQRGVRTKVPRAVFEVLQNSKKQDLAATAFMEEQEARFSIKVRELEGNI